MAQLNPVVSSRTLSLSSNLQWLQEHNFAFGGSGIHNILNGIEGPQYFYVPIKFGQEQEIARQMELSPLFGGELYVDPNTQEVFEFKPTGLAMRQSQTDYFFFEGTLRTPYPIEKMKVTTSFDIIAKQKSWPLSLYWLYFVDKIEALRVQTFTEVINRYLNKRNKDKNVDLGLSDTKSRDKVWQTLFTILHP